VSNRPIKETVLPPAVIGILGGGQLGRMMALDGRKMGYRFVVLDPTVNCPAAQVADEQIVASYTDNEGLLKLSEQADVITYEFENVDATSASILESSSHVPQGSELLFTTQHRVREKSTLRGHGLPVTPFVAIHRQADLRTAMDVLGERLVIKTCMGGYDGKGQWMVQSSEDLERVLPQLEPWFAAGTDEENPPLIAEQFISFVGELSVVVARNGRGETAVFPPAENEHVNHILHLSIVPARYSKDVVTRATELASRVATSLDVVGLVAVELFVNADGELFINELAPRPHNSGHYTMDACPTSQFEQHLRAVCLLGLGDVELLTPVVMVNILGKHLDAVLAAMDKFPGNVKVHLYGKSESRPDRKMGHLNILCDDVQEALDWVEKQGIWQ
jgi:5-(carboxyamino)imidazole ribonucleotide synthase